MLSQGTIKKNRTTHAAGSYELGIWHRTRSRAKNYNKEVTILHQAFGDYCSTKEGESELSRNKHRTRCQHTILYQTHIIVPSHWCHDERPCSGTVPYTEGPVLIQPSSGHHKQHTWNKMQLQTSIIIVQ